MATFADDKRSQATSTQTPSPFYRTSTSFNAFSNGATTSRMRQHSYPSPGSADFPFDSQGSHHMRPAHATTQKYNHKLDFDFDTEHNFDRLTLSGNGISNAKGFGSNTTLDYDRRPSHPVSLEGFHGTNGSNNHQSSFISVTPQSSYGPHLNGHGLANTNDRHNNLDRGIHLERSATISSEEICTIFVVGFPDDMQEREFQNMFTFASGFEAATLKIPHRDPMSMTSPSLSNANSAMTNSHNGFDSWDTTNGNLANQIQNPRKQIIGFAKFRTRSEALSARDALQGRRVDLPIGAIAPLNSISNSISGPLGSLNSILGTGRDASNNGIERGGCILKAEMAKKNLHTKRGISAPVAPAPPGLSAVSSLSSITDEWEPVPTNGVHSLNLGSNLRGPREREREREEDERERQRERAAFNAFHSVPAPPAHQDTVQQRSQTIRSSGGSSASSNSDVEKDNVNLHGEGSSSGSSGHHTGLSGIACERREREKGVVVDQNPPINTLYVGNLPSSPTSAAAFPSSFGPSAGVNSMSFQSPATAGLEDALRELFGRCPGFRKLVFRMKGAGPMCFVEFDDTSFATRALTDLAGHTLGGRVKAGGIRLSYSKNPLGVRTPTGSDDPPPFGTTAPPTSAGSATSSFSTASSNLSNAVSPNMFGIANRSGYVSPANHYTFQMQSTVAPVQRELTQPNSQHPPRFFTGASLNQSPVTSSFVPTSANAFASSVTSPFSATVASTFAPFGPRDGGEAFGRALSPA